jgi:hypothetical protein
MLFVLDLMLSIFALIAANVAMQLFADTAAAAGDQAEHGFRLMTEATQFAEELQVGNPS